MIDLHLYSSIRKLFIQYLDDHKLLNCSRTGRPRVKITQVFKAIVYMLYTGVSWRMLPRRHGARSTVHRYFQTWVRLGLFQGLWERILRTNLRDKLKSLRLQIIDGTVILNQGLPKDIAHVSHQYGPKRGIKMSVLADSEGRPIAIQPGLVNEHDTKLVHRTLEKRILKSIKGQKISLLGDKGYVGKHVCRVVSEHGYHPVICLRRNAKRALDIEQKRLIREHRYKIERTLSWLKSMNRLRLVKEKNVFNFIGWFQLGCAIRSFR